MIKDLLHYLKIKKSGRFNEVYYLLANPDVRKADVDPLMHFIRQGWKEGRNPSPDQSNNDQLREYLSKNKLQVDLRVHHPGSEKNRGNPRTTGR